MFKYKLNYMIKDKDEALLKQFKNSEMRKSIEMRVDELSQCTKKLEKNNY